MGGLVSRYALAYMEKRQYALTSTGQPASPQWDHNTTLWISLDAPHQGANIPIGLQEFLRYFQNFDQDAEEKFNTRLNTTAAKQLLVHHHSAGAYTVLGAPGYRDRFMLALRDNGRPGSLGYPELLRRVGISNGRLDGGLQVGSSCGIALQMDKRVGIFKISLFKPQFFYRSVKRGTVAIGDMEFAPSNTSCYVFKGQIDGGVKLLTWNWHGPSRRFTLAQGTTTSYDLVPGGWYDTQRQISANGSRNTTYKNVVPNSCFIPTVSALGFQYRSMSSYQTTTSLPNPVTILLGRNLRCNDEIPFDAYFGASSNIQHVVGKDMPTSTFLGNELAGVSETPVFVSAPTSMCAGVTATFTVRLDCPRASQPSTTFTWTPSANLTIVSGQGTASVTVRPTPSFVGTTTLKVQATRTGYPASAFATASVFVGTVTPGTPSGFVDTGLWRIKANTTGTPGATSYNWYLNGVLQTSSHSTFITIPIPRECDRSYDVQVEAITSCGTSARAANNFDAICPPPPIGFQMAVYPNPATNQLTVESVDAAGAPVASSFDAVLTDQYAQDRKSGSTHDGKSVFSTRDLPAGLYFLRIVQHGKVIRQQIEVRK